MRDLDIPVIAAGGVMDGAGIAACLMLGAEAAQLGTAFIACSESSADSDYRAALLDPSTRHTVLTTAISGRPARSLLNRLTAVCEDAGAGTVPAFPIAYDAAKALYAAAKAAGEPGYGPQWAGQGARLSRPLPAATLVAELLAEMERTFAETWRAGNRNVGVTPRSL